MASSNSSLASLTPSAGALYPTFNPSTLAYTVQVLYGTTQITLTPVTADPTATVQVNGVTVASGHASGAIPVGVGQTIVPVIVTAQDGSQTPYSVIVTQPNAAYASFVVEDGTIVAGANSYVDLAEANAYYTQHLYPNGWATATDAQKQASLVMATRMLNRSVVWKGAPINHYQPLQWPRQGVIIHYMLDLSANPILGYENTTYPSYIIVEPNIVPQAVKDAVCEYARYLLASDRDVDKDQAYIKSEQVGPMKVEYDWTSTKDFLPEPVIRYVRDYITEAPSSTGAAQAKSVQARRS